MEARTARVTHWHYLTPALRGDVSPRADESTAQLSPLCPGQACSIGPSEVTPLEQQAAAYDAVAAHLGLARSLAARLSAVQGTGLRPSTLAEAAGAVGLALAAARDHCATLPPAWPVRRLVAVLLAAHIEQHGAAQLPFPTTLRPVTKELSREPALRRAQAVGGGGRPSANFRASLARAKTPPTSRAAVGTGGGVNCPRTPGKRPLHVPLAVGGLSGSPTAFGPGAAAASDTGRASSASLLSRAVTPEASLRSLKGTPDLAAGRRQPSFLSEVRALLSAAEVPQAGPKLAGGFSGGPFEMRLPLLPRPFDIPVETTAASLTIRTSTQQRSFVQLGRVEISAENPQMDAGQWQSPEQGYVKVSQPISHSGDISEVLLASPGQSPLADKEVGQAACPQAPLIEPGISTNSLQGLRVAFGDRRSPAQRKGWRERPRSAWSHSLIRI